VKERLLFIDLLRIIGISLVLWQHICTSSYYPSLAKYALSLSFFDDMVRVGYGGIGVGIFLFASGCSLAYSNAIIRTGKDIKEFYSKRLFRIYPTYWTAILLTLLVEPFVLQRQFTTLEVFKYAIGFQAWGAKNGSDVLGKINGPFWFLTPLLSLYIMYPFLLYLVTKRPHLSLVSFLLIQEISTYLLLHYYTTEPDWSPLYWLFIFGLGMYIMKMGWYPKKQNSIGAIVFLSNIIFYVYLINEPLDSALLQYPVLFFIALFAVASMFYTFDRKLHEQISRLISIARP